ncbi:hypothetical protein Tco_0699107 [Tanacetum coccineum]
MQKESVSKQGRKPAKAEPTVHKDPAFFDDLDDDAMAYIETEDAQDEGKTSSVVLEEKESADKEVSTEVPVSTVKPKKKEKEKGVEIRDAKNSDRPRATSTRSVLTLKPLLKIDPKDKGKKVLEEEAESDAESELVEEEATKVALTNEYDFIHARINADKILAKELQKEEREKFTVEQRAKFLHDTIAAQRKFLAQQSIDGGKKHSDLKTKTFEEIQEMNEESKDPEKKRLRRGLLMKKTQQRPPHSPEGVVRFTNGIDEIAYKMPHMIEQYNSLSDLEIEHTKSVYLRNEEDKRRGVEYVMSKILGFYKECLELGPEYVTEIDDEGDVT